MGLDGMHLGLGGIARLADARTRSISGENVYGDKGRGAMAEVSATPQPEVVAIGQKWDGPNACARDLGRGWKVRPCITLAAGQTTTLADIAGPGCIQHLWITTDPKRYRELILRCYWDGEETPSVETPLGDFFCCGWKTPIAVVALPLAVNPRGGMNSFFPMPFRRHARLTIENRAAADAPHFFYTINYALGAVGDDDAYFHAQFRRTNPQPYKEDYTILDGVRGRGHYVGTCMAWQQNSAGWWGEGEFKAFLDGDTEFPTICGTGTEDYFGGAWGFGANYSGPFMGYPAGPTDGKPGGRHHLYRFHIMDPIRFATDLRVTMQALGWQPEGRYLPLRDDIASVAYWYQSEPHAPFPALGGRDDLEAM